MFIDLLETECAYVSGCTREKCSSFKFKTVHVFDVMSKSSRFVTQKFSENT